MPKTDVGFFIKDGIAYLKFDNDDLPDTNPNINRKVHHAEYAFKIKELRTLITWLSEELYKYDEKNQGEVADA